MLCSNYSSPKWVGRVETRKSSLTILNIAYSAVLTFFLGNVQICQNFYSEVRGKHPFGEFGIGAAFHYLKPYNCIIFGWFDVMSEMLDHCLIKDQRHHSYHWLRFCSLPYLLQRDYQLHLLHILLIFQQTALKRVLPSRAD